MKRTFIMALAVCLCFAGCDGGNDGGKDDGTSQISVSDPRQLNQTAWADEENTGAGFTFTALDAWTVSSITETRAVSWITGLTIGGEETTGGAAGTYTMKVGLTSNTTGSDRKARITITSGTDKIDVNITQSGTKKNGETDYGNGTGWIRFFDSQADINHVSWICQDATSQMGGVTTIYIHQFSFVKKIGEYEVSDEASAAIAVFSATEDLPTGVFQTGMGDGETYAEKHIGRFAQLSGVIKDVGSFDLTNAVEGEISITLKIDGDYQIAYDFSSTTDDEPVRRMQGEWTGAIEGAD